MLLGEYEHTIDEKNRLTLPAKFRKSFAGGLVLTRGIDRCLAVYPRDEWERGAGARVGDLEGLSRDDRRLQRFFFASAAEADLDGQGRVMVPAALMQHAGLARDVTVAGVYDHLEIWDRAAWRAEVSEVEGSAEDVAERLASKRD
jgi:transcriptional regulator MraZ